MILQIKLLSDLCVSSGEVYNSYVDIEVVYDEYGIPYIPAKRIKGCIREAALELAEWGIFEKEEYHTLFGKEGTEKTLFSLDNAYLKDYEKYLQDLVECKDRGLVHPQRVLNLYTYTRTQTAMTQEGVADKGTLRTIRVINKGLIFYAKLEENTKLTETQRKFLEDAVSMVKHIGTDRTRGLGLVELTLSEEKTLNTKEELNIEYGPWNRIEYMITLKAPVLCKGAQGSLERTCDYIEGSKVLGILAQNLPQDDFRKLMCYSKPEEGIVVSNAYICEDGERYTPNAASLQKEKDQSCDSNGNMTVADLLWYVPGEEQRTPIGQTYISVDGRVKNVEVDINYHHSRTEDKSIGKANGLDGSAFYQLESIRRGQQFKGYIIADREQAVLVERGLQKSVSVRIGNGRNAEYGKAEIVITKRNEIKKESAQFAEEFTVKLNSAVILYNENGIPSADVKCLKKYIAEALQVEDDSLEIRKAFLNYETIGGFNVTWKRRKPTFTALGKGTVCRIYAKEAVDISRLKNLFVGERIAEGYGELEISLNTDEMVTLKGKKLQSNENGEERTDIIKRLRTVRNKEEIRRSAVSDAKNFWNDQGMKKMKALDAVMSKLILIVKNEKTLEEIKQQVEGIESIEKRELTWNLLHSVEVYMETAEIMFDKEEAVKEYLYSYLNQMKYQIYKEKKGEEKRV